MQPESAAFLWDVRAAGVRITTFADGLTAASYAADELRKSAIERRLEIIGEALNSATQGGPRSRAAHLPTSPGSSACAISSPTVTPSSTTASSGAQSLEWMPALVGGSLRTFSTRSAERTRICRKSAIPHRDGWVLTPAADRRSLDPAHVVL